MAPRHAPAEPFFLDTARGARFCLFHAPSGPCRGALLYIHPFAEEMNRARRMAAVQARAFAAHGVAVLLLDLHGCGDSGGDFADASWAGWLADIEDGRAWLEQRTGQRAGLWGLRLGALLALEAACAAGTAAPARLLLWQPVTEGESHLKQFLRLRVAADMLHGANEGSMAALRAQLDAGTTLEIAGYGLAPSLAGGMAGASAGRLLPPCPVDWLELAPDADRPLPPAAARTGDGWRARGAAVRQQVLAGPAFWSTPETTEAPALVEASLACLDGIAQATGAAHA